MTCERAFAGWSLGKTRDFCSEWLRSWSGGNADRLMQFYADDAFCSDLAVTAGLSDRPALRNYFGRLLPAFPDWRCAHDRRLPVPHRSLNYCTARLIGSVRSQAWSGVCIVILRERWIIRNDVVFDRSPMINRLRSDMR